MGDTGMSVKLDDESFNNTGKWIFGKSVASIFRERFMTIPVMIFP